MVHFYRLMFLSLLLLSYAVGLTSCKSNTSTGPIEVKVTVSDFKIESSVTTFTVGTTYHFVITNKGAVDHDWMIMPQGEMDENKNLVMLEDTDLKPGVTLTKDFKFEHSGNFEFACHVEGHYEKGMHTPITAK